MNRYAIGIDLGATYSCVGVVKDGQVKIIHNDCGSTATASCVAFTDKECIIGDPAKAQGFRNFQNTVFDVKRLIGRKFSEAHIQNDIRHWPFTVVDQNGTCGVQVQFRKQTKTFSPEELSAMVLTKMKKSAEDYLRQEVTDAVITVPAYFNNSQRQATKDAAAIAGLNVLRIIDEPTAAGIAYALDEKMTNEQNILIYDLGGGTFDVTIMTVQKKNWWLFRGCDLSFWVRSISGHTHLGGEDFNSCLVDYCVADIKERHNMDISSNKRALRKLRTACETGKKQLSYMSQTTIEVDGLINGEDFSLDIGRSRFEHLCVHLIKRTLVLVEMALVEAKMTKEQIDEIVLVGGSTRIPGLHHLLRDYFNGKKLNNAVHPDEAVAYGAAVQAAILAGNTTDLIRSVKIQNVTAITLGQNLFDRLQTKLESNKVEKMENSKNNNAMAETNISSYLTRAKEEYDRLMSTAEAKNPETFQETHLAAYDAAILFFTQCKEMGSEQLLKQSKTDLSSYLTAQFDKIRTKMQRDIDAATAKEIVSYTRNQLNSYTLRSVAGLRAVIEDIKETTLRVFAGRKIVADSALNAGYKALFDKVKREIDAKIAFVNAQEEADKQAEAARIEKEKLLGEKE